jgi:hypothetical protein
LKKTLHWKAHIDHLLPQLCMACYSNRTIKHFMCQENLKSIYHSYFHSLMKYGIIFWGNYTHSIHAFRLQKRVIRIITDSRPRDSCRQLFKKMGILPLMSHYAVSLLLFTVNNKDLFQINSQIHSVNTRNNFHFHRPLFNLTKYKNGTYYAGIKVLNYLPTHIKNVSHNVNQFRLALRDFLHLHSFYTLEEYFNSSSNLST